jgi:hypothetical protein
LFVEFFELVDPALQARDVAFERVHGVLIRFSSDRRHHFAISLACGRPSLFVPKKECGFLCVFFGPPSHCRRPHLQY